MPTDMEANCMDCTSVSVTFHLIFSKTDGPRWFLLVPTVWNQREMVQNLGIKQKMMIFDDCIIILNYLETHFRYF